MQLTHDGAACDLSAGVGAFIWGATLHDDGATCAVVGEAELAACAGEDGCEITQAHVVVAIGEVCLHGKLAAIHADGGCVWRCVGITVFEAFFKDVEAGLEELSAVAVAGVHGAGIHGDGDEALVILDGGGCHAAACLWGPAGFESVNGADLLLLFLVLAEKVVAGWIGFTAKFKFFEACDLEDLWAFCDDLAGKGGHGARAHVAFVVALVVPGVDAELEDFGVHGVNEGFFGAIEELAEGWSRCAGGIAEKGFEHVAHGVGLIPFKRDVGINVIPGEIIGVDAYWHEGVHGDAAVLDGFINEVGGHDFGHAGDGTDGVGVLAPEDLAGGIVHDNGAGTLDVRGFCGLCGACDGGEQQCCG